MGAKCPKLSYVIDISVAQNLGTGHQQYLDKKTPEPCKQQL